MKPTAPDRAELQSRRLWFAALTLLFVAKKELLSQWGKVAQSFGEEEVHDLRVASRRLREALALFAPCFPERKVTRVAKLVKRITRRMGDLRNIDEALLFLSTLAPAQTSGCGPELAELKRTLTSEREGARATLATELAASHRSRLRRELQALAGSANPFAPGGFDPFAPLPPFAADALAERAEIVFRLIPDALKEADHAAQHRLRIAVKKLRYRVELLGPLFGEAGDELRAALKGHQDVLGKLHDMDVFAELVRERVKEGAGREELLQVIAGRRKEFFASFAATIRESPLEELTERALASV